MAKVIWLVMIFSLIVTGCSTNEALNEAALNEQYPSVQDLKHELAVNKGKELDLLSPAAFKKANNSYQEAVKLASKDNPKSNEYARDGFSQLAVARTNADTTRYLLEDVLTARKKAVDASANERLFPEFKVAEKDLLGLTTMIESGDVEKAKRELPKILAVYQGLELEALKIETVESAKVAINNAHEREIEDLAPKTLKLAEEEYQLALNVLDADLNNRTKAEVHAKKSLWYAQQANEIADVVIHFDSSEYTDEDKVLWYQGQISSLVSPMTKEVSYNLPNKEVIKGLNANIQTLLDTNIALLDSLESTAAGKQLALLQSQEILRESETLSKKVSFIETLFSTKEADVYRQNDNVLIRAHGFDFPSGYSEIESTNFALVNKVIEAVNQFPDSNVVVSGHTDNIGNDDLNMQLSEDRAKKVAKFLNEVGRVDMTRINFEGYGKTQPVADNSTKEGRAANRRVEILIVNNE